jgi:hypothetical protein
MQPSNDIYTSALLVILLIATNLKPILMFHEWLNFKINTTYKQYRNELKNKVKNRSQNSFLNN